MLCNCLLHLSIASTHAVAHGRAVLSHNSGTSVTARQDKYAQWKKEIAKHLLNCVLPCRVSDFLTEIGTGF